VRKSGVEGVDTMLDCEFINVRRGCISEGKGVGGVCREWGGEGGGERGREGERE